MDTYEELVTAATKAPFAGWDFRWLDGRLVGDPLPWDYPALARTLAAPGPILDVDTGGGEILAGIDPPSGSVATEAWEPNVAVAAARLTPLGARVVRTGPGASLPFAARTFAAVLNRHAHLDAAETARVLASGGRFLTQQVGSREGLEINAALGVPPVTNPTSWTLDTAVDALRAAGLRVIEAQESLVRQRVLDIGALVYHLRAVTWQVPGFTTSRFDTRLRLVDGIIRRAGHFVFHAHRFLVHAECDAAAP